MRMGLALERNGLLTEAAACMEKAVKFDPSLADAHRALGRLSTDAEDIVAALEQACRLVPDDYDLRVQYGAALVEVPETLLLLVLALHLLLWVLLFRPIFRFVFAPVRAPAKA
jgi:tetratricopeptide (TPR) repeat protein